MGSSASVAQCQMSPRAVVINKEIEAAITYDQKTNAQTFKLLLLGNEESGKSTLVKQMKIVHLHGFNLIERLVYKNVIVSNVVDAIKELANGVEALKINTDLETLMKIERFLTMARESSEHAAIIQEAADIFQTDAVQQCFKQRHQLSLLENVEYFMTNLKRIGSSDYLPNDSDVLYARANTTGVQESQFRFKNHFIRLIDVGGQKTERRKWIHCFDDVTAVLFVVALSAYDQTLIESETENRMLDALALFQETCAKKHFSNAAFILFLNKKDVFEDKIKRVPLKICFDNYIGGENFEEAANYIRRKFLKKYDTMQKRIYSHFTNAIDTKNIEKVFSATIDSVIKKALKKSAVV